jgi:predicted SprT family Zn-dependent metalloprotease
MLISGSALKRRVATLMIDFGVKGYTVRIGGTGKAWALCNYTKKELVFSPTLLWTDWPFANQIAIHEVAHIIAGRHSQHGRKWKQTAEAMGYRLGAVVPYGVRAVAGHQWVSVCETRMHCAMRYERGSDELLCRRCWDEGAGEVRVLWEKL